MFYKMADEAEFERRGSIQLNLNCEIEIAFQNSDDAVEFWQCNRMQGNEVEP